MNLQTILCPVDLTDASRHALKHAVALARWYDARLVALHAYAVLLPATAGRAPIVSGHTAMFAPLEEEIESVHADVEAFVRPLVDPDVELEIALAEGSAAVRILETAARRGADLVVMGMHGRGLLDRIVLGSVTERVLHAARCPVLVVPQPCSDEPAPLFANVLCAVDFSEASLAALEHALSIARESGGRITLLHVVDLPADGDEAPVPFAVPEYGVQRERDAAERLAALVPADARRWCEPAIVVRRGKPYREILALAAAQPCDLIVLGVHGTGPLDALFVGSTANHVVRRAGCPVLTAGRTD